MLLDEHMTSGINHPKLQIFPQHYTAAKKAKILLSVSAREALVLSTNTRFCCCPSGAEQKMRKSIKTLAIAARGTTTRNITISKELQVAGHETKVISKHQTLSINSETGNPRLHSTYASMAMGTKAEKPDEADSLSSGSEVTRYVST